MCGRICGGAGSGLHDREAYFTITNITIATFLDSNITVTPGFLLDGGVGLRKRATQAKRELSGHRNEGVNTS